MSLILRKECQNVLDTRGLQEFHVQVSKDNCLSIVTECGKTIVTIFGIVFSRKSPTQAEITYAVELLGNFLDTHKDTVDEYMREYKKVIKMGEPVLNKVFDSIPHKINSYYAIDYEDGIARIKIVRDGRVKVELLQGSDSPVEALTKFKHNPTLLKHAMDFTTKTADYSKAVDSLHEVATKLGKCSI